jgi:tetratricopeptide (TPR) repeat protein
VHWSRRELPEAIAGFERSLAIRQQLLAGDPKDALMHSKVAFAHKQLGGVLAEHGDNAAALQHLHAALDEYGTAALNAPQEKMYQFDALIRIGDIEETAGQHAPACRSFRRAFDVVRDVQDADRRAYINPNSLAHAAASLAKCGAG